MMLLPMLTYPVCRPITSPTWSLSCRASSPEDSQTGGRVPVQSVQHPRAQAPEELLQIPALQVCSVQATPRGGALHHLRDASVRNTTHSACPLTLTFSFRAQIHGRTVPHPFSGSPFHATHLFLPNLTDFFLSCLLTPLLAPTPVFSQFPSNRTVHCPLFSKSFCISVICLVFTPAQRSHKLHIYQTFPSTSWPHVSCWARQ